MIFELMPAPPFGEVQFTGFIFICTGIAVLNLVSTAVALCTASYSVIVIQLYIW